MGDWTKSDQCDECGGDGYIKFPINDLGDDYEYETEQCAECERLHKLETRADRIFDELKESLV